MALGFAVPRSVGAVGGIAWAGRRSVAAGG